jgi:RimJ/RimL family protein N-acetyltransferase
MIPTLYTNRLRLRPPVADDFPAYQHLMASERARYMGGPFDTRDAWGLFCHDVACWSLFGHGALMIEVRSTGECAGQVGINHGPQFPEKELGWILYDGFEGFGYATEAATAIRDWAKETLNLRNLVSYIDSGNAASVRVALRLGAVLDLEARRQDPEDLVYRHHL